MDEEDITFVLLAYTMITIGEGKRYNTHNRRKHRHRSLKPSATLSHRIYIADVHANMLRTSRCVCVILNLDVLRRIFADCCALLGAARRYIADGSWRCNVGRKFQYMHQNYPRCSDALVKHGDYSRTSPIICQTIGA